MKLSWKYFGLAAYDRWNNLVFHDWEAIDDYYKQGEFYSATGVYFGQTTEISENATFTISNWFQVQDFDLRWLVYEPAILIFKAH